MAVQLLSLPAYHQEDIFHIVPPTNTEIRGISFTGFSIVSQAAPVGQDTFHLDTRSGSTTAIGDVVFDNVYMSGTASAGGYSIYVDNGNGWNNGVGGIGATGSANGGTIDFTVHNCFITGNIDFVYAGDGLRVLDSFFTDNVYGGASTSAITLNQEAGAGNFLMDDNDVAGTGGGAVISQAVAPIIDNNEFEQQLTNTETDNSIIDLTGSVANISNAKIVGNQIQAPIAGTGNPTLIRVANAAGTIIDDNRLGTVAAYAHIVITSAASNTLIGAGNTWTGGGTNVSDSSGSTVTLAQSGADYGIGTTSPTSALDVNGGITSSYQAGFLSRFSTGAAVTLAQVNTGTFGIDNNVVNSNIFGPFLNGFQIGNSTAGISGYASVAANSGISFYASTTEAMRIIANGNVGIGTTSPYATWQRRTRRRPHPEL
jgi:hypothetical protein